MQNQGFIIAKEGVPWILIGALMSIILYAFIPVPILAIFSSILTCFFVLFFRNPKRTIPNDPTSIVSPADGKVCLIMSAHEKRFLNQARTRVSIFMSPLNCHVNRSPLDAKIKDTHYNPGKFHFAKIDKASELNEQHAYLLEDKNKNQFVVVQIAGWLCRRIVSYVKSGQGIQKGQRLGIIQFGSRVDIYLPSSVTLEVQIGDHVKAGESILGNFA